MSALLIDSNCSSLAESFYAVADFDPNVTFSDGTRLINHPLDEVYLRSPCGLVAAGMIPKSEFQVRAAMLELSYCTKNLAAFGFFSSLFQKAEYKGAVASVLDKQISLRNLVNRTAEHKAAIRRIVSDMQPGNQYLFSMYCKEE